MCKDDRGGLTKSVVDLFRVEGGGAWVEMSWGTVIHPPQLRREADPDLSCAGIHTCEVGHLTSSIVETK